MAKNIAAIALVVLAAVRPNPAIANENDELRARIEKLEQELQLLKRQAEVKQEVDDTKAQKDATIELDKKGLSITSADKNIALKLGGYMQIDDRTFFDDTDKRGKNDILIRSVRPTLSGILYKDISFAVSPDFGNGSFKLFDAYGQYKYSDPLQLRFGKFKAPLGLERLQSPTDTFFAELGPTSNLVPNRDLGVMLLGELIPETLEYQIGLFDGGTDLSNNDTDDDDSKDIIARIFAQPFKETDVQALQGLGVGIAGSVGSHKGSVANSALPAYKTAGQSNFFTYRAGAFANGDSWRVVPQMSYYNGSFGLLGEYAISSQEVALGGATETVQNDAWLLSAAYVLTGENENYKGSVKPDENFDPRNNNWGALELVARIGETNVDDDSFAVFADPTISSSNAFDIGVGLNWYWNENVRWMLDYDNTSFDGGRAGGDRRDENVIITRLQFKFN